MDMGQALYSCVLCMSVAFWDMGVIKEWRLWCMKTWYMRALDGLSGARGLSWAPVAKREEWTISSQVDRKPHLIHKNSADLAFDVNCNRRLSRIRQ